jgi:TatD DNase family protein
LNLADTHCHLQFDVFKNDLDDVLERAWQQGLNRILIPAVDLETCEQAIQLCDKYSELYAAIGVHPNDASKWTPQTIRILESLIHHPKVVAVGEIGLDYFHMRNPISIQIEIFQTQLELALEYDLPVIIHSRQAATDVWNILSEWQSDLANQSKSTAKRPGVLHSYDGKIELAKEAVEKNFFIGVGGPVTFPKSQIHQEIVTSIPLQNLLLETDAPFLTPIPFRGKRNEPSYITVIAARISEVIKLPLQDITTITSQNANSLFAWGAIV